MKKNDTKKNTKESKTEDVAAEFVPCEMFLESTGFFSASSNRIRTIFKKEKTIRRKNSFGQMEEVSIKIKAIHDVGLPSTFDQDLYRAFLKICDEAVFSDGSLPQPLNVPTKKLLRYAGKSVSAWYVREVKNWFVIMGGTHIIGEAYNARTKSYERIGSGVFETYVMRGQKSKSDLIATTNEVYLSEWFIRNYEAKYFRLFDLTFYNSLRKPVSKALLPLLESGWYASSGKSYRKSYNALCDEFLLQNRKFESRIKEQLDPAHRELQKAGFLNSWEYKRSGDHDFILTWIPGKKWFEDQKARTERKVVHKKLNEQDQKIMENRKTFHNKRISENLERMRQDLNCKMAWQKNIEQN